MKYLDKETIILCLGLGLFAMSFKYLVDSYKKADQQITPIIDINCDGHKDLELIKRGGDSHYFISVTNPKTNELIRYDPKKFDYNDSSK